MTRARRLVLALIVVLLLTPAVAAAVGGSPNLSVYATDSRVKAGEVTRIGVSIVNTGEVEFGSTTNPALNEEVRTAKGVVLTLRSGDAPIEVLSDTAAVGSVPSGAALPASFEIRVKKNAEPGTYRVPVTVSYQYTENIAQNGRYEEVSTERTKSIRIRVTEHAQFELVRIDTDAAVGGSGQVEMTLRNDGSATAEDATVSVQSATGDLRFGASGAAETFLGDWKPGETRTVVVGVDVARDATVRALPLSTTISWTDADGRPAEERVRAGVVPETSSQIAVGSVTTTASTGDTGKMTLELTNTGDRDLQSAAVELSSSNAGLSFGGSPSTSVFIGEWDAGETKQVTVEAAFAAGVERRPYPIRASVSYDSDGGREANTAPVTVGVTPAAEQSFALRETNATLRVGEDGVVSGVVRNEGPATVENAVLVFQPTGSISTAETEYALGDLRSGESAPFRFDVAVSSEGRDGPRQFTYHVEYEENNGRTRSDPLYVRATVQPARDVFEVTPVDATVSAGGSTTLTVEVRNAGDEPVRDVSAKLFADAPVGVSDDEAFVDQIVPGESREIVFRVQAAGGATPKAYPLSLDFQYTEPDGDTKLSDTYTVPVQVTDSGGGGFLTLGGGAGVGLAAVAALALVGVGYVRTRS